MLGILPTPHGRFVLSSEGGNFFMSSHHLTQFQVDFSGGSVARTPSFSARDVGSIPGWVTKIPHAEGQLSPCATTREKSPSAPTKSQQSQKKKKKVNSGEMKCETGKRKA